MRTHTSAHTGMARHTLNRISRWGASVVGVLGLVAVSGCNLQFSTGVEAKDVWTRSYKVNAGATLELKETNGRIHIAATDGDEILVKATRTAKGPTDEAAKAALAEVKIAETASADRVSIDSSTSGLLGLGQPRRVDYDIQVPRSLSVTLKTTNGEVQLRDVAGFVRIEAVNGSISATGLEQGADVGAVNGRVTLEFAKFGDGGARCKTTNGQIVLTVPSGAKATISARVSNGVIRTENLSMQASEESRHRLDATIGGGGAEIRLETMNGEVKIVGR